MIYRFLLIISLLTFTFLANAQNTVGVLSFDPVQTQDGYNFYMPHRQMDAYLLDNCGRVVNHWPGSALPGNSAFLKPNGNLVRTGGSGAASNPWIHAGGGGEYIEELDWGNNSVWKFTYNDSLVRMHHDFALLPNGNVLFISWERKTAAEAIAMGRDPLLITYGEVWPDKIVEIQPQADSAIIVWEWNVWDHLIQDFDATKPNFGVVADHPERININYGPAVEDWNHLNAIDYNPVLDQIVLSSPSFNELWIIDHSTTTAEAAGTTGGNSGKGGDLLYRWGNPAAYNTGTSADQLLYFQHDVSWIDNEGIATNDPDYGKLLVFNNRVGSNFSSVNIINPPLDTNNNYVLSVGSAYGPSAFDFTYTDTPQENMHSIGLSGAQRQPNGNILICSGRQGRMIEINANKDIVWEYINPKINGAAVSQGDPVLPNTNLVFRFIRYLPSFAGFVGKDMTPGDFLELNPDSTVCSMAVSIEELPLLESLNVFPNPSTGLLTLDLDTQSAHLLELYNGLGQRVFNQEISSFPATIDLSGQVAGVYWLSVDGTRAQAILLE